MIGAESGSKSVRGRVRRKGKSGDVRKRTKKGIGAGDRCAV